jgi:hypothetical protein
MDSPSDALDVAVVGGKCSRTRPPKPAKAAWTTSLT